MTPENIAAVEKLLEKSRRITYRQIGELLHISAPVVHCILHDCLKVKKVCTFWVPYALTEIQKLGRVKWCKRNIETIKSRILAWGGCRAGRLWHTNNNYACVLILLTHINNWTITTDLFVFKIKKNCKSWKLSSVLSHHVHMYWIGKAEERRRWLRIPELKITAFLRACKIWILNFKLYVLNVQFWI